MESFDVVIAGAGYAGVMCALRLGGRLRGRQLKVAVVSPIGQFIERLRLHEGLVSATAPELRTFALGPLLGNAGVTFIQAAVARINREAEVLELRGREAQFGVRFDRLVVATGSTSRNPGIPGAEHAYTMEPSGPRDAAALRILFARSDRPRILVIGGGATGVEVAAEIAVRRGARVTLATDSNFGGFAPVAVARLVRKELATAGVTIMENCKVSHIGPAWAETSGGRIDFDICVLCAGFHGQGFIDEAGLEQTASGRILVDPFLRSLSDRRILAAGDACMTTAPHGAPPRMSVFFALATGAHVADFIADELAGNQPRPFGFWTYGQAIGLGSRAVGFASFPFDTPLPPYYTGRVGYQMRRFFVWLLFQLLLIERRWPGLPFYLGRRRRIRKKGGD